MLADGHELVAVVDDRGHIWTVFLSGDPQEIDPSVFTALGRPICFGTERTLADNEGEESTTTTEFDFGST